MTIVSYIIQVRTLNFNSKNLKHCRALLAKHQLNINKANHCCCTYQKYMIIANLKALYDTKTLSLFH